MNYHNIITIELDKPGVILKSDRPFHSPKPQKAIMGSIVLLAL